MKIRYFPYDQSTKREARIVCETKSASEAGLLSRFAEVVRWLWEQFRSDPNRILRALDGKRLRLVVETETPSDEDDIVLLSMDDGEPPEVMRNGLPVNISEALERMQKVFDSGSLRTGSGEFDLDSVEQPLRVGEERSDEESTSPLQMMINPSRHSGESGRTLDYRRSDLEYRDDSYDPRS